MVCKLYDTATEIICLVFFQAKLSDFQEVKVSFAKVQIFKPNNQNSITEKSTITLVSLT